MLLFFRVIMCCLYNDYDYENSSSVNEAFSYEIIKYKLKNIKKWEWDSRHMCEDIIRVLGNTTISLRKENEDMQQHILELEKAIELQNENISTLKTKLKHPVRTLFQKIADSTH